MTSEILYNLNSCRLCLSKTSYKIPIFDDSDKLGTNKRISLHLKILFSVSVDVKQDAINPCWICQQCHHKINSFYEFKTICSLSDVKFQEYYISHSVSKVKEEHHEAENEDNSYDFPTIKQEPCDLGSEEVERVAVDEFEVKEYEHVQIPKPIEVTSKEAELHKGETNLSKPEPRVIVRRVDSLRPRRVAIQRLLLPRPLDLLRPRKRATDQVGDEARDNKCLWTKECIPNKMARKDSNVGIKDEPGTEKQSQMKECSPSKSAREESILGMEDSLPMVSGDEETLVCDVDVNMLVYNLQDEESQGFQPTRHITGNCAGRRIPILKPKVECIKCKKIWCVNTEEHPYVCMVCKNLHACTMCDRVFRCRLVMLDHLKLHNKFACLVCKKVFHTTQEQKQHSREPCRGDPPECKHCDGTYEQTADLEKPNQHKHDPKKRLECQRCGEPFKRLSDWRVHNQKEHGTKHMCTYCMKTFVYKSSYDKHSILCATGKKERFTCGLCNIQFLTKAAMCSHRKLVHEGPKDVIFTCKICEVSFQQKGELICHEAFYHREEINRKVNKGNIWTCDKCGEEFVHRGKYVFHKEWVH